MKMFKKLMAVALAGVLALTVLTGCGSSIDRKEFVRTLNDYSKFYFEDVELTDAGTAQADKVIGLVQAKYEKAEKKDEFEPMKALYNKEKYAYTEVAEALGVDENTKDYYCFNIVEVKKNTSEYNKKYATAQLAKTAMNGTEELTDDVEAWGNKGTVSFNTVTLGDTEYLVIVVKVIA